MADTKVVTFTLPSGTRVTCDEALAKTLGHEPPKVRAAAAKRD